MGRNLVTNTEQTRELHKDIHINKNNLFPLPSPPNETPDTEILWVLPLCGVSET